MASTQKAYLNSGDFESAKERHFFSRAEIEEFFESCPSELLSRRFRHFLRGVWIAAGRPFGGDIQVFKAVENYRQACYYRSSSTVRYNLRASEKLGLLEICHRHHEWVRPRNERDRGLYRRVTTHRLPISLLVRWRELHRQGAQADVTPIRKPSAPAQPPKPPAPAAPLPSREKPAAEHRSTKRVTRDERLALFSTYLALRKSGKAHEAAIAEVCRQFKDRYTADDIEYAVKIVAAKKADHEERSMSAADRREMRNRMEAGVGAGSESTPFEPPDCLRCDDTRIVWNYGPGKRRIPCPECSGESEKEPGPS
jgi:hypothetical protein